MAESIADLHFHSHFSDGKHSVDELVGWISMARQQSLKLAVLTDHDGIESFLPFKAALEGQGRDGADFFICSSELSCTTILPSSQKNRELHLLVYGLDPADQDFATEFMRFRAERERRFDRMVEALGRGGLEVDGPTLKAKHPGVLGRPHVADALVERGYVQNRQEAFERFLYDGSPFNISKWRFDLAAAIALAKRKGCRTSIAHPGQYGFDEGAIRFFKEMGVDGVEVFHPRHGAEKERFYLDLAARYDLMVTGGSDFHDAASDCVGAEVSLGRRGCPWHYAEKFLEPWL